MNKTQIQEINIDLIQDLRLSGRRLEAKDLLAAYHKNRKAEQNQLRRELKAQDRIKKMVRSIHNSHDLSRDGK